MPIYTLRITLKRLVTNAHIEAIEGYAQEYGADPPSYDGSVITVKNLSSEDTAEELVNILKDFFGSSVVKTYSVD